MKNFEEKGALEKILGIDPGFATVGFGVIETTGNGYRLVDHGCIITEKQDLASRLKIVYDDLRELIRLHKPQAIAVEELFFFKNLKTAIDVGHSRGVILLAAKEMGVSIYEYTPLQIKQALTGYGHAEKRQVQEMVQRLLKLDFLPKPDDAADALAAAFCHNHSRALQEKIEQGNR